MNTARLLDHLSRLLIADTIGTGTSPYVYSCTPVKVREEEELCLHSFRRGDCEKGVGNDSGTEVSLVLSGGRGKRRWMLFSTDERAKEWAFWSRKSGVVKPWREALARRGFS